MEKMTSPSPLQTELSRPMPAMNSAPPMQTAYPHTLAKNHPHSPVAREIPSSDSRSENRQEIRTESLATRRSLNPALFSDSTGTAQPIEGSSMNSLPHVMQNDQKIYEMKTQIALMSEHFGRLSQNFTEFAKAAQLRFDKLHQSILKLDQNDHQLVNEASQKFARINDRFAERKSLDAKIQEMVDRHNSVLKSFEMRLSQMSKVLAEKEALLLATSSALSEAKMEIARMKRL